MTEIEITEDKLIVHVQGIDRIWSFKSQLEVPIIHIVGAEADPSVAEEWRKYTAWRVPGTAIPGVIRAGTYYTGDGKVFWDVHDPQKAITITLADEKYSKLVIEVADPAATVATIEQAVRSQKAS